MRIVKFSDTLNRGLPLVTEIRHVKNPTVEKIKEMYGDFGVDLFVGKETPSIINKRPQSKNPVVRFINRVRDYFSEKAEYEPNDTMYRVVNKYIYNEKKGLTKDIEQKFGKGGMSVLRDMELMGYVQ